MYTQRSREKEILDLDESHYSPKEYEVCMKKLFKVNCVFGFFNDTVRLLKNLPKNASLIDIGCGSGLFLLHLSKHFPEMQLLGVDINPSAIRLAEQELQTWRQPKVKVSFQLMQQKKLILPKNSVDAMISTLVCHHLEDEELIAFLQDTHAITRHLVMINDLHRHVIPQFFFKLMSPWLFRNRLIHHDGLISIRRGFTRQEWECLLQKAGISDYKIEWRFPFRWRVTVWKKRSF